ncbi:DUF799 domain-containing protein [Acetobacter thailandicus]|uniref:DUF799 domain-containing protein n=1 Tax=Acetobacter thailandicus TaxID=1502842 RepID=A0ABT3QHB3_9PROT|nr:DUF799 domain-containing protein [Acetobacter thailandicus]MCX2564635.1 DUF799 domain-containing protein [Acetobacter thailandicus]NHN95899.1 hypothetical protein [Acetobacter thailandicus]
MTFSRALRLCASLSATLTLVACASKSPPDYTAFRNARPRSVLVMPPINHTNDIKATAGVMSQMTMPIAEDGYYVVPVAVEMETFRHNGLDAPDDIMQVPAAKLRAIFGADAALYSTVTSYGTSYNILSSNTIVTVSARLVDLKDGSILWSGSASATDQDAGGFQMNGIVGALIKQTIGSLSDESFSVARVTDARLLSAGPPDGLLYGPRNPRYGTD